MSFVHFNLEVDSDGLALVTWNSPARSMNVLDAAVIEELSAIVEQVAADAAIKGVAVSAPRPLNDSEVSVRIEYVYQDRNEAQTMHLENVAGEWKIVRGDGADSVKTAVPYGTPIK